MSGRFTVFAGGPVFDGVRLHDGMALVVRDGRLSGLVDEADAPPGAERVDLAGDILSPGFVDLQVNGGGGVLFNDAQDLATLDAMARAHRGLGATTIFPTLITDTRSRTRAAIEAVAEACARGLAGIGGLHLEGPHLSHARKGAHDPALIRPMEAEDLDLLISASGRLPALMVTVAPEAVTPDQVRGMAAAGIVVSLGHTDADFATCLAYRAAGATCATHLFNAMSQLGNRTPGLVGAVLDCGDLSAGLIADGIHVHPAVLGAALRAKRGPGRLFLVSDAMAVAGTSLQEFRLNGRPVRRAGGCLTLEDGTLAGADLDLLAAVRNVCRIAGLSPAEALSMATSVPAGIGRQPAGTGRLAVGARADLVRIAPDLSRVVPVDPPDQVS